MAHEIVFRPQAEAEALEVRQWYESRRPGLGQEFGQALDLLVARIVASPLAFRASTMRLAGPCSRAFLMQSISVSIKKRSSCWRFTAGNTRLGGDAGYKRPWFVILDTRPDTRAPAGGRCNHEPPLVNAGRDKR